MTDDDIKTTLRLGDGPEIDVTNALRNFGTRDALRAYLDRLVTLHGEKAEVQEAIKDVYADAKGAGFSVPALRVLVSHEMQDAEARAKRITVAEEVDRMKVALGLFLDTPLGQAAAERAEA